MSAVDEYVNSFSPEVKEIILEILRVTKAAVHDSQEVISYKMPALKNENVSSILPHLKITSAYILPSKMTDL